MGNDTFRRVVHLSDAKRAELLRRLDDLAHDRAGSSAGGGEPVHAPNIRVTIHHPGGGVGRFLVSARHITPTTMWMLHSGFLHPGTRCVFAVPRGAGQEGGVVASVAWCEHFERGLHAVGVRFDDEIDPSLLVPGAAAAHTQSESIELPSLEGRLLLLDDQRHDRALLAFHLRSTGVKITHAEHAEDALIQLGQHPFDAVVCDLNLGEMTGEAAMRAIRANGFDGPIVVLTGESSPNRLKQARRDGAFAVIEKPYDPRVLIHVLADAIAESVRMREAEQPEEPIVTTVTDPEMLRLVESYLGQVRDLIALLDDAASRDDFVSARRICVSLKGSGAGYGYETLSRQAESAVRALDASCSVRESRDELEALRATASRLAVAAAQAG